MRGIKEVIQSKAAKPGKFYYIFRNQVAQIFLCINSKEHVDGSPVIKGLFFNTGEKATVSVMPIPFTDVIVEVTKVHLRIVPRSIVGTCVTKAIEVGDLIVAEDTPYLCVPVQDHRDALVDLDAAQIISGDDVRDWVAFKEWSLVIDDANDQETVIAKFPATD